MSFLQKIRAIGQWEAWKNIWGIQHIQLCHLYTCLHSIIHRYQTIGQKITGPIPKNPKGCHESMFQFSLILDIVCGL